MLNPVDVHIGKQLRILRIARKFTQNQLANQFSEPVAFQQVQKYENGKNRLSASRLWELCAILRVDPYYFFDGME